MISLNEITKLIDTSPIDDTLYLIDKCSDIAGFFVFNKSIIYMAENLENADSNNLQTEYLVLRSNTKITAVANCQQFNSGYYNLLEYKVSYEQNPDNFKSFINLCFAHIKYMKSQNFIEFFNSMIDLFQLVSKEKEKNIYGLFGELSVINYAYKNFNINLASFWHTASTYSKYDFVMDKINIEVKTSNSLKEVLLKHSQIFNEDNNVLAIAIVENNNSGITLEELIDLLSSYEEIKTNFNFLMNLEIEKQKTSLLDFKTKKLKLIDNIFFDCKNINPFKKLPSNVSNLEYRIDLLLTEKLDNEEIKKILMN